MFSTLIFISSSSETDSSILPSSKRYSSKTVEILKNIDLRTGLTVMHNAGFDEPFFYDEKYLNTVLKSRETKAIRTLCLAYGIQNINNLSRPDIKEIIEDFVRDPKIYIYPSAVNEVKKAFIVKRKLIRRKTDMNSLHE